MKQETKRHVQFVKGIEENESILFNIKNKAGQI